jgi:hypothetical protein
MKESDVMRGRSGDLSQVTRILERHEAFWNRQIVDRVCISVTAPASRCVVMPKAGSDEEYLADPTFVVRREEARIQNTYYAGDALPTANAEGNLLYPAWGGKGRFESGTVWADPSMHDWREWSNYCFDPDNIWIRRFLDTNRALAEASNERWWVATQGFFGATDALALVRGYEEFLMDLAEEDATAALRIAQRAAIRGHKEIITRAWDDVQAWQRGTATNPGIWAPGRINYWSADFSCMIGPADFEKWLAPEFEEMINLCEYSLYHLDGPDAVRHLPRLGQFEKLKGIQYTVGPQVQKDVQHWLGVAKQIQSLGKATWLRIEADLLETAMANLDPRGLFLFTRARDEEHADWIVKQAAALTSK